jgi:hypothetical protein
MKTLSYVLQVNHSLGFTSFSPAPYFFLPTKKSGGAQQMGSYTLNNSISIFFGTTCSQQVTNNN